MILELLPDVQRLPASQKRQLAEELLTEADAAEDIEVDPAIVELLESRLAAYESDPHAVSSWEDVKARVFRRHGS
jgi:putative addiction module component (TIGR02574 family)